MKRLVLLLSLVLSASTLTAACTEGDTPPRSKKANKRKNTDPATGAELPDYNDINTKEKEGLPNPLEGMLVGQAQNDALCNRLRGQGNLEGSDPNLNSISNMLCKEGVRPTSITELLNATNLRFGTRDASGTNGSNDNPGFALLAHTQSLLSRSTSAINPRAFIFSAPQGEPTRLPGFTVVAFVRGEPFIEVAAQDQGANKITFYLIKFDLACEANHNCQTHDLLTPAVESNWTGFTVYDEEDLKNTLVDCRSCHQPDGPGTPMMLRMQELEDPWTHWMRSDRPGGRELLVDYVRAHSEQEDYAGIPGAIIQKTDGRAFEDLVKGQGFTSQPNVFDSQRIEDEVAASQPGQPLVNIPRGSSPTWEGLFQRAFNGEFIPVPYHDVKVTDPDKLQIATDEYQKFKAGAVATIPDIRRVFLDDALEAMTMLPKLGASGREVLVQTCAQCHNPKLDQTISRAKFDVTRLDSMSRADKDLAIQRLKMSRAERLAMPPAVMRYLPDDAREAAIKFLEQ